MKSEAAEAKAASWPCRAVPTALESSRAEMCLLSDERFRHAASKLWPSGVGHTAAEVTPVERCGAALCAVACAGGSQPFGSNTGVQDSIACVLCCCRRALRVEQCSHRRRGRADSRHCAVCGQWAVTVALAVRAVTERATTWRHVPSRVEQLLHAAADLTAIWRIDRHGAHVRRRCTRRSAQRQSAARV